MLLRTIFCLTILLCLFADVDCRHNRYMVRKGGRLERLHKRTLSEWKRATHHRPRSNRHKRRRHERDGRMHIEHVLAHMDSFVRPRFGR